MTYSVYLNFVNRIAKYHETGCSWIRDGDKPSGTWRHNCADLRAVFDQGLQFNIKAVVPADCCLEGSTEAKCIGCAKPSE